MTNPPYTALTEHDELTLRNWAQSRLSAGRFHHTEGVVATVDQLARQHNLNERRALRIAGWVHDAAKELDHDTLLSESHRLHVDVSPIEANSPQLLHGAVALAQAKESFGFEHPAVTSAVLFHTTGSPEMTPGDKAFYLADLIEPSRSFSWVNQARALAMEDIDKAMVFALTHQIRRLLKKGLVTDPRGLVLRNNLIIAGVPLVPRHYG